MKINFKVETITKFFKQISFNVSYLTYIMDSRGVKSGSSDGRNKTDDVLLKTLKM